MLHEIRWLYVAYYVITSTSWIRHFGDFRTTSENNINLKKISRKTTKGCKLHLYCTITEENVHKNIIRTRLSLKLQTLAKQAC